MPFNEIVWTIALGVLSSLLAYVIQTYLAPEGFFELAGRVFRAVFIGAAVAGGAFLVILMVRNYQSGAPAPPTEGSQTNKHESPYVPSPVKTREHTSSSKQEQPEPEAVPNLRVPVPVEPTDSKPDVAALPNSGLKTGQQPETQNSVFPTNWKSLTSGARYEVRQDSGVIYGNLIQSDFERYIGVSATFELREGQSGYAGTYHWVAIKAYNNSVAGRCAFDFPTEIVTLSASRIEGRTLFLPANSKIDFKHCSQNKNLVWQNFIWIPE